MDSLVSDFTFEGSNFSLQCGDFTLSGGDGGGGDIDSSVVLIDFVGAFSFLFRVDSVSLLLLDDQVLSNFSQHLSNVSEGALVLELQGNSVQNFLSELFFLELFQLVVDAEGGL